MKVRRNGLIAALASGCVVHAAGCVAQSCASPQFMLPDVTYTIDTCSNGFSLASVCGGTTLTGPAIAFTLYLPYPQGAEFLSVTPTSGSPQFDPLLAVESHTCGTDSACPLFADNAGAGGQEVIDVGTLDSGVYYVVISTEAGTPTECGAADVIVQSGLGGNDDDGIFRSGFNY
ncbi:MAG TPA: hypothetical protein VH082_02700 [Rudaea sp.]|jgi:hypothetical protein|nr:hypothetical protein [Rudaea sp.]